jgi:hypothetical protein
VKISCIALAIALSAPAVRAADLLDQGHPRTPKRVWIRRTTLIAGCAASLAFDTWSTRRAISTGAIESNGLFANAQGQPQWGRMIGIKAGICGASLVLEETHVFRKWQRPDADWTWTGINAGTATLYIWAGWHNLQVARR